MVVDWIKYPKTEVWVTENFYHCLEFQIKEILLDEKFLFLGGEVQTLNLKPRELLGIFLIACVARENNKENWEICSDPESGDGGLYLDSPPTFKRLASLFEQVVATSHNKRVLNKEVCYQIASKSSKGPEYVRNRNLIVLCTYEGKLVKEDITETVKHCLYQIVFVIKKVPKKEHKFDIWVFDKTHNEEVSISKFQVKIKNTFKSYKVITNIKGSEFNYVT